MKCVASISFQVKVNGKLLPAFSPSRGIRQGGPISPYLFLLCGEALSCMLKNYDVGWVDQGIRVGVVAPWFPHLLFADDCLIFMKADGRSTMQLNKIMQTYSVGSGKCRNKQNNSDLFSLNTRATMKMGVKMCYKLIEKLCRKVLGFTNSWWRN